MSYRTCKGKNPKIVKLYLYRIKKLKLRLQNEPMCQKLNLTQVTASIYKSTNFKQTQLLRATIVNYIYDNWDEFRLFTSNARGDPFCSRQEYKVTMLQSSSYGGTAEVKAAGILFPARRGLKI